MIWVSLDNPHHRFINYKVLGYIIIIKAQSVKCMFTFRQTLKLSLEAADTSGSKKVFRSNVADKVIIT